MTNSDNKFESMRDAINNGNEDVTATGETEFLFKIVGDRLYLGIDITEAVEFFNSEKENSSHRVHEAAEAVFGSMRDDD